MKTLFLLICFYVQMHGDNSPALGLDWGLTFDTKEECTEYADKSMVEYYKGQLNARLYDYLCIEVPDKSSK